MTAKEHFKAVEAALDSLFFATKSRLEFTLREASGKAVDLSKIAVDEGEVPYILQAIEVMSAVCDYGDKRRELLENRRLIVRTMNHMGDPYALRLTEDGDTLRVSLIEA